MTIVKSGNLLLLNIFVEIFPMTSTPFLLSGGAFTQNWSNAGLITANNDWSGVPSIEGFLGQDIATTTGVDPQTLLTVSALPNDLNVIANQTNPNTLNTGGVAEFDTLSDPAVALQGSGTADVPYILIYLNTTGVQNVNVAYNLRDLDGSTDNAIQPVALQYRVGNSGNFINIPSAFVADASTGPSLATLVTPVSATLPAAANNQALVQVRVITANAVGNDEWIGIDDISITSTPVAGAGVIVSQSGGSTDVTEGGATDTFTIALNSAPTGNVNFSFTTGAQVTVSPANLTFTTANFATPQTITVTAVDDDAVERLHTGTIQPNVTSTDAAYNNISVAAITANITDNDVSVTKISAVQGTANTSPSVGQTVTIEGIVVGDFQATGQIGGFFVQEEDADADANPFTSEGISVFSSTPVNVGDKVRVTGSVAEFGSGGNTLTQLGSSPVVTVISSNNALPTAATVNLPVVSLNDLERFEGMRVTFPNALTVSETFTLARFGEILLSADGRRFQPTEFIDPNDSPASGTNSTGTGNVIAITNQQNANNLRAITLDDGLSTQNPSTIPYLNAQNTRRIGDTVTGLTGVLDQRFPGSTNPNGYRIQPTGAVTFADTNPRPLIPPNVGNANVKVGSFNLLNFFTTIDNGTNVTGPSNLSPRGAQNLTEFNRQINKTSTTIFQLNADVLGLIELENNGTTAITTLVNAVNAKAGGGTYAFIQDPVGYTSNPGGTDAIKVAFIYKPSVVTPIGNAIAPINESAFNLARAPIAQTFLVNSNGAAFTPVINHFKSKGSSAGLPGDEDQGDGQSLSNASRKAQSVALTNFINNTVIPNPNGANGDRDVLILGDLNAYGEEDPIDILRNAGYTEQIDRFGSGISYSFVFQGQSGSLDHALASPTLNSQVSGAADWHINADEPIFLDYNLNFKATPPNDLGFNNASTPDFFNPAIPFRASDHDPLLVGLNLAPSPSTATVGIVNSRSTFNGGTLNLGTNTNDNIIGSANSDTIAAFAGNDFVFGGDGNDSIDGGFGDDTLLGGNGADTLLGNIGNDSLIGGAGADLLIGGAGNDFFVYNSFTEGGDTIADFASGDKILIRAAAFGGLVGVNLVVNGSFANSTPGFLFNSTSGLLSFDSDGNGLVAPVAIATLTGVTSLISSDISLF
jgi:uncharacterized protein